jgi:hypothetical protein
MSLTVSHFNPNFEEWEDTELATREDVLAAVREWDGVRSEWRCVSHKDQIVCRCVAPVLVEVLIVPLDTGDTE